MRRLAGVIALKASGLDAKGQISGLRKLKLTSCASAVAWVEHLRETHGLGVSNVAQPVGYGAIAAARWSDVVLAPNPPYELCSLHSLSAAPNPVHCYVDCIINGPGIHLARTPCVLRMARREGGPPFWQNELEFMNENKHGANHWCEPAPSAAITVPAA